MIVDPVAATDSSGFETHALPVEVPIRIRNKNEAFTYISDTAPLSAGYAIFYE
jgi:hypothetical protein